MDLWSEAAENSWREVEAEGRTNVDESASSI